MTIINSLDFEMNQPSGAIIQLGAAAIDLSNGRLVGKLSLFVNPHETLDKRIIELTGIDQEEVDTGMELEDALRTFWDWTKSKRLLAWGYDAHQLLEHSKKLGIPYPSVTIIDLKGVVELMRPAFTGTGKKKRGLLSAMQLFGLEFQGRQHDGLDDAYNTARLAYEITKRMKAFNGIQDLVGSWARA